MTTVLSTTLTEVGSSESQASEQMGAQAWRPRSYRARYWWLVALLPWPREACSKVHWCRLRARKGHYRWRLIDIGPAPSGWPGERAPDHWWEGHRRTENIELFLQYL